MTPQTSTLLAALALLLALGASAPAQDVGADPAAAQATPTDAAGTPAAAPTGTAPAPDPHHPRGGPRPTHNAPHPTTHDARRVFTTRPRVMDLPLPEETDAFSFVVFGDRTGGPAEGIEVLADAVDEVNLLEPDLVMTVGDLIQGYNRTPQWLEQMREYKAVMDGLLSPWFPVAGNHDVYWRGEGRPPREHEADYEQHFGPLWYAFEHKDCWFVVLHSDEGDPASGAFAFDQPDAQRISDEQLDWLKRTLLRARGARHVFLFLHHPRWIGGGYGDDWERVHELLVAAGNVTAVFAGHVHHMRYDPRDGIEYVTLATVGGGQSGVVPEAGFLHHYLVVTVRDGRLALSSVPVGELFDPRALTPDVIADARALLDLAPEPLFWPTLDADFATDDPLRIVLRNPVERPVELTVSPEAPDRAWTLTPDHQHLTLGPGQSAELRLDVTRRATGADRVQLPRLRVAAEMLTDTARIAIPAREHVLPLDVVLQPARAPRIDHVLALDGEHDALLVPDGRLHLPDGPLTLECWLSADAFAARQGLVTKTEGSEFGLFVNGGRPEFLVHLDGEYVTCRADDVRLASGRWQHLAGVFDGAQLRLYLDGRLVASADGRGARTRNSLPLVVGGDVDRTGRPVSLTAGQLDEVRLSRTARYGGEAFEPTRRHASDDDTVLLLSMDAVQGPWVADRGPSASHAVHAGDPRCVPVTRR